MRLGKVMSSARQTGPRTVEITFPDPDRNPMTIRLSLKCPENVVSALNRAGSL